MKKTLIIGCGNISALYDIDGKDINTHCKVFEHKKGIELYVFDLNISNINIARKRFNFQVVDNITYDQYDLIIIATSTKFHFQYLKNCLLANCPVVLCEKPIVYNEQELTELEKLKNESKTLLYTNYIRNFLSEYNELKNTIQNLSASNDLIHVNINYTRGVSNNFSHALSLLKFLITGFSLDSISAIRTNKIEIENDPTLSFKSTFQNAEITTNGLSNINYSFFEIEIFFSEYYVKISDAGNTIELKAVEKNNTGYKGKLKSIPGYPKTLVLKDYMENVYNSITTSSEDNFENSFHTQKEIFKITRNVNISN